MAPDKPKFKQMVKEIQEERIRASLILIDPFLRTGKYDDAEQEFARLVQDLGLLDRAGAVADKV